MSQCFISAPSLQSSLISPSSESVTLNIETETKTFKAVACASRGRDWGQDHKNHETEAKIVAKIFAPRLV